MCGQDVGESGYNPLALSLGTPADFLVKVRLRWTLSGGGVSHSVGVYTFLIVMELSVDTVMLFPWCVGSNHIPVTSNRQLEMV